MAGSTLVPRFGGASNRKFITAYPSYKSDISKSICEPCQGILKGIIENEYHEYVPFSDARQMPISAIQCPSCAMILEAVSQNHAEDSFSSTDSGRWKGTDFRHHLGRDRVLLRGEVASNFPFKPKNGDSHFSGVNVVVYSESGELRGYLGLYENPGKFPLRYT